MRMGSSTVSAHASKHSYTTACRVCAPEPGCTASALLLTGRSQEGEWIKSTAALWVGMPGRSVQVEGTCAAAYFTHGSNASKCRSTLAEPAHKGTHAPQGYDANGRPCLRHRQRPTAHAPQHPNCFAQVPQAS